jgi:hypothetical protein
MSVGGRRRALVDRRHGAGDEHPHRRVSGEPDPDSAGPSPLVGVGWRPECVIRECTSARPAEESRLQVTARRPQWVFGAPAAGTARGRAFGL